MAVDAFPITATGTIKKIALRTQYSGTQYSAPV